MQREMLYWTNFLSKGAQQYSTLLHFMPLNTGIISVMMTLLALKVTEPFAFCRTTAITGYLPQELIGSSGYEYFHQEDLNTIAISHRRALQGEIVSTDVYRFRCKAGHYLPLRTCSNVFRNPWSKELEFLVCVNTVVT